MIQTERLTLRPARTTDLADVHAMLSDPRAMRYWSRPEHDTIAESRDWLAAMIAATEADDYLIEHQGRIIGKAGMWRRPEIGFLLHPDFHGRGFAHEAMEAVIDHLFATHDLSELVAEADPRNAPSLRLLARLGFHETGRASRTMQWRNEWCDSVYLALSRAGWVERGR
jgi:RimJ/RimL family protein N-acetyltransferase